MTAKKQIIVDMVGLTAADFEQENWVVGASAFFFENYYSGPRIQYYFNVSDNCHRLCADETCEEYGLHTCPCMGVRYSVQGEDRTLLVTFYESDELYRFTNAKADAENKLLLEAVRFEVLKRFVAHLAGREISAAEVIRVNC